MVGGEWEGGGGWGEGEEKGWGGRERAEKRGGGSVGVLMNRATKCSIRATGSPLLHDLCVPVCRSSAWTASSPIRAAQNPPVQGMPSVHGSSSSLRIKTTTTTTTTCLIA